MNVHSSESRSAPSFSSTGGCEELLLLVEEDDGSLLLLLLLLSAVSSGALLRDVRDSRCALALATRALRSSRYFDALRKSFSSTLPSFEN